MHAHAKPQPGADNTDRHSQIAGRADGNAVTAKEFAKFRREQLGVVVRQLQQPR
ncbi:hypothetical protein D3C72_2389610 [compost metagenome]